VFLANGLGAQARDSATTARTPLSFGQGTVACEQSFPIARNMAQARVVSHPTERSDCVSPAAGGLKLLDRLRQAFAVRWTGFEAGEEVWVSSLAVQQT